MSSSILQKVFQLAKRINTPVLTETYKKQLQDRVNRIGKLTYEEFQILIGSILGDGHIELTHNSVNYCYKEGHAVSQKEYLLWKYHKLKRLECVFHDYSPNRVVLKSPNLPIFTELRRLFYNTGRKYIPKDIIDSLTPLSIAVVYGRWHIHKPACVVY